MKRVKLQKKFVKLIKTIFFWNTCEICGYEFRREDIWEILLFERINSNNVYKYACKECCKTEEDASRLRDQLLIPPTAPPPPPLPKYYNTKPRPKPGYQTKIG